MITTTSSSSRSLLRSLLREAHKVNDYNFRSYAIRRVKAGFRMNSGLEGNAKMAAIKEGEEQLAILRRQVIVGNLYPSDTSVMESTN